MVGAAVGVAAAGVALAACVAVTDGDGVAVEEQPTTSAPMAMEASARVTDLFKVQCCLSLYDKMVPVPGCPATVARDGLSEGDFSCSGTEARAT